MKLKAVSGIMLTLMAIGILLLNAQPVGANPVDFDMLEPIPMPEVQAIWVGDLNDDGIVDIAVAHNYEVPNLIPSTPFLWIMLGLGDCTFSITGARGYPLGDFLEDSHVRGICGADLDGDGDTDLAIANQVTNTVLVLLNKGDGTFEEGGEYSGGVEPMDICCADFDGDGDIDLATANYGTYLPDGRTKPAACMNVLRNIGDATFTGPWEYHAYGNCSCAIVARDFDMDGDIDLMVGSQFFDKVGTFPSVFTWFRNRGDGTFTVTYAHSRGLNLWDICSEDFDGDNDYDLAVAYSFGGQGVGIFLNDVHARRFIWQATYELEGGNPEQIFAGDFDYDGDMDLAVTTWPGEHLFILDNDGHGTFSEDSRYGEGFRLDFVSGADLDGDRDIDLVAASEFTDVITVFKNRPEIWGTRVVGGIVVGILVVVIVLIIISIYAYYHYYYRSMP